MFGIIRTSYVVEVQLEEVTILLAYVWMGPHSVLRMATVEMKKKSEF